MTHVIYMENGKIDFPGDRQALREFLGYNGVKSLDNSIVDIELVMWQDCQGAAIASFGLFNDTWYFTADHAYANAEIDEKNGNVILQ